MALAEKSKGSSGVVETGKPVEAATAVVWRKLLGAILVIFELGPDSESV